MFSFTSSIFTFLFVLLFYFLNFFLTFTFFINFCLSSIFVFPFRTLILYYKCIFIHSQNYTPLVQSHQHQLKWVKYKYFPKNIQKLKKVNWTFWSKVEVRVNSNFSQQQKNLVKMEILSKCKILDKNQLLEASKSWPKSKFWSKAQDIFHFKIYSSRKKIINKVKKSINEVKINITYNFVLKLYFSFQRSGRYYSS